MTDKDRLDVATQNRLMLEMLLETEVLWKPYERFARERMAVERERTASEWCTWDAEREERTE